MSEQYTTFWRFMTRSPAGQLALATALAIGISGVCAAYVFNSPKQTAEKTYISQMPENNYQEISDIVRE